VKTVDARMKRGMEDGGVDRNRRVKETVFGAAATVRIIYQACGTAGKVTAAQ
jgi:hypothetical protein